MNNSKTNYKQTLQKIKDLAATKSKICPCEDKGSFCWECDISGEKRLSKEILKIISEVQRENN